MVRFRGIYPPSYSLKSDPNCPGCGEKLFFVGATKHLEEGCVTENKLYQCSVCRRLFEEIKS